MLIARQIPYILKSIGIDKIVYALKKQGCPAFTQFFTTFALIFSQLSEFLVLEFYFHPYYSSYTKCYLFRKDNTLFWITTNVIHKKLFLPLSILKSILKQREVWRSFGLAALCRQKVTGFA